MINDTTPDNLPLTQAQMAAAPLLSYGPVTDNSLEWDNVAFTAGYWSGGTLQNIYRFTVKAGATYYVSSISYFDPGHVRVFDMSGNVIATNSEADDPASHLRSDGGYYDRDAIVLQALASGTYYVAAEWDPGYYYDYYEVAVWEDIQSSTLPASYSVSTNTSSAIEGSTVEYTIKTTGLAVGSILTYTLAGMHPADIVGARTGSVFVGEGGVSKIQVEVAADRATEGDEVMVLKLSTNGFTKALGAAPGVTIRDTSLTPAGEVFRGTAGNDSMTGGIGTDTFYGEGGLDTVTYANASVADFSITNYGGGLFVVNDLVGTNGRDSLMGIERISFKGATYALDIDGNAGQAYRLYQAAFDRTPDAQGLGYWIRLMDQGMSLGSVAREFTKSEEFIKAYGTRPTNTDLVSTFYENILGRNPDTGGLNYWVGLLDKGLSNVPDVLANISESEENQIGLIGVIGDGFAFAS